MLNLFRTPHIKEITLALADLDRRITSAELDLVTRESHVEELHEKRNYLTFRLGQLNGAANAARESLPSEFPSNGGDPP